MFDIETRLAKILGFSELGAEYLDERVRSAERLLVVILRHYVLQIMERQKHVEQSALPSVAELPGP